jgi:hypothetical protein
LRTLHQIRFVTQVEPAVKLLEVQEILDEGERSNAAIALASAISSLGAGNESVVANAREFTTSYPAAIAAIGSWIPSLEPASREAVISAARQMVWMGLKTGLCDDAPKTIVDPVTSKRQVRALQSPDRLFNEQIAPFSSARETPAITDRDLAKLAESSRLPQPMGAAESESTFFSPELRRLRDVHFLLSTAPTDFQVHQPGHRTETRRFGQSTRRRREVLPGEMRVAPLYRHHASRQTARLHEARGSRFVLQGKGFVSWSGPHSGCVSGAPPQCDRAGGLPNPAAAMDHAGALVPGGNGSDCEATGSRRRGVDRQR